MSVTTMNKLRAIAVMAHLKIHKNRFKDVPGKWHPVGFSSEGERLWNNVPLGWLHDKLREEVRELEGSSLALRNTHADVSETDVLMEAGDVCAMAMMIADRVEAIPLLPKIVVLSGSTKFKEAFDRANWEETLKGNIVLSVGGYWQADSLALTMEEKKLVDEVYLRKIDLADEVYVLNVGGYIGESTLKEIVYALNTGKGVRYLESRQPSSASVGVYAVLERDFMDFVDMCSELSQVDLEDLYFMLALRNPKHGSRTVEINEMGAEHVQGVLLARLRRRVK